MGNIDGTRQTETGATSEKSEECLDSSQSQLVGTIQSSNQSEEAGQIGCDRGIVTGFFAGKRSLDEAILHQLLSAAKKGLKNAEACIDWYEEEKREYEKQVAELEELVQAAQLEAKATNPNIEEE